MPWCPKCKAEYRDSFNMCSECDVDLVTVLEVDDAQLQNKDEKDKKEEWVLLINVADGLDADLKEGLLKSCGINVIRKHGGIGDFVKICTGFSNTGVDFYVPESQLTLAKEILESKPELDEEEWDL